MVFLFVLFVPLFVAAFFRIVLRFQCEKHNNEIQFNRQSFGKHLYRFNADVNCIQTEQVQPSNLYNWQYAANKREFLYERLCYENKAEHPLVRLI